MPDPAPGAPTPIAALAAFAAEQAVLDHAHDQLARMRARAEHLLHSMKGADPDLEWALARRVRSLADSPRALCFGRIDGADGTSFHIGRRHVEDATGDPVVVEWRAPVALPYYRAGWAQPMGLVRRVQWVVDGRTVVSVGEDDFTTGPRSGAASPSSPASASPAAASPAAASRRGAEALLVELDRARSGEMVDIVATIQPEQDAVIRSPAEGVLAVQGGPGSGKTAVGLHRAAYLLYGDDAMARANVLVVGPNRTFLRYIGQVLPSLGESAVVQTTLTDLVPEVGDAPGPELSLDAERVKGDGRMATVLARALDARRHAVGSAVDLVAEIGVRRLVVPGDALDEAMGRVASRSIPYADGRDVLRDVAVGLLAARYEEVAGPPPDGTALGTALRRSDGLRAALDARWPSVPPATLVADVLSKPAVLAAAADGVLSASDQAVLRRRRGRAWTVADGPLLDEAKALVAGQSRTYGHAIVDEAQDLSPMQLRMLARRVPSGSMTLLGDLAQSIGVWARPSWDSVGEWLSAGSSGAGGSGGPRSSGGPGGSPGPGVRVEELRYGYRSPAQVLELAGRLLPEAAPDVTPTEAVRAGRTAPTLVRAPATALLGAVVAEVGRLGPDGEGWATVAVIAPAHLVDALVGALRAASPSASSVGEAARDGLGRPVTVVAAEGAKGLEFDAVVVVEPGAIVAERPERGAGLRMLYVALTRPTQHLSIVHSSDLPAALAV